MSVLLRMYPGDAWAFLIANVLVQVTVVTVVAWLLARLGSRWNAAWRHSVCVVALICVLASPVLSSLMQAFGIALVTLQPAVPTARAIAPATAPPAKPARLPVTHVPEPTLVETPLTPEVSVSHIKVEAPSLSRTVRDEDPPALSFLDILRALAGLALVSWLCGTVLLMARWCYGLRLIALPRRASQPLDCEAMPELLNQVRRALETDQLPTIATSPALDRPIMVGLIHPLVLLPEDVLRTLHEPELADVLVHECAHAVCRHHMIGLVQRSAGILLWPHPLVHWLNRELARAREEVCDNYVLRRGDAPGYARTLLELSQLLVGVCPKPTALGLFNSPWRLEDRVADLLDRRRRVMIRVNRWTAAALTATFLLLALLIAGTRVTQAQPAAQERASQVKPQVEKRAVNKRVKDFPYKSDLSTPESAMAAWSRSLARKDIPAALDLSWVKLDAESAKDAAKALEDNLPENFAQQALDTQIVEVLTYNDNLAAIVFRSDLLPHPPNCRYSALHFGRIKGEWKNLEWREEENLAPSLAAAEEDFGKRKGDLWQAFVKTKDDIEHGRTVTTHIEHRPVPALSAAEKSDIKRWQGETWQMGIDLDMPSLEPQAVQYAILDGDPVPAYIAQVKRMREHNRQQLEKADNEARREQLREIQMTVAWNFGFKNVTGDNLYLLAKRPGGHSKSGMMSNAPGGRKWIVTKVGQIDGKPVCWCIPVAVTKGENIDVTFDKSNTFDLRSAYDNAMQESEGVSVKDR